MKRLIWSAGVVLALAAAQNIQATPVRGVNVSVTGGETLNSSPVVAAKAAMTKAPTASSSSLAAKVKMVSPLLSSIISPQVDRALSTTSMSRESYLPESLISKFNPKAPVVTTKKPTPTKGPATPAAIPDGGATASLFSMALLGTALMRRKFAA